MSFGENLSILRKKSNVSQEALAEELHITRQAISKWESGMATPDIETIIQISKIFGVTIDELVLGKTLQNNKIEEKRYNPIYILSAILLSVIFLGGIVLLIVILNPAYCIKSVFIIIMSLLFVSVPVIIFTVLVIWNIIKRFKNNRIE